VNEHRSAIEFTRTAVSVSSRHTFLTHEFIAALVENREPTVDIHEALAMTAPGIIAHESSLKGGEQMKVPSFDKKAVIVKPTRNQTARLREA
jgi:hypothetical protein